MVNVIFYLKKEHNPKKLVSFLLGQKLIASATIDLNNISYKKEKNRIKQYMYNVVTAQTKSLLFSEIIKLVSKKFGDEIRINSVPIINSNPSFNEMVMNNTKLI
jgi:hypothetical protein